MSEATEILSEPETEPAAAAEPGSSPRVGWRASWVYAFWIWLAALVMYGLVTAVSWWPFGDTTPAPALSHAYESWHRWDTTWYVIIAESGYRFDSRSAAFFPLYPLLIHLVDYILPRGAFEAALVISVLACLVALAVVHRFATDVLGPELGRRTAFYLLAFPTGFYLAAGYNESLFIALAVGSLYCMRRRKWWLAGLLAGFASGTRLAGILLAVAFAYEYLRQRGFDPRRLRLDAAGILLAPLGLVLYGVYCWRVFDDPLFFERVQANWFRAGFQLPWVSVGQTARLIAHSTPILGPPTMRNIINLTTALAVLALLVVALDRRWGLGREYAYLVIFSAGVILMPLCSPIRAEYPLSSMWRFALECLPVFMVLAKFGRDSRFDRLYTVAALGLQGAMILTFVQNQFVA